MDGKHPNQSSMENGFCGEFPNVTMMITRDDGRRKRETEKKRKREKEKKKKRKKDKKGSRYGNTQDIPVVESGTEVLSW